MFNFTVSLRNGPASECFAVGKLFWGFSSGEFYVCTRNDKSIAYLALGLSYPGVKDAERGYADGIITKEQRDEIIKANQLGKQPPWDTPLGGAIEIHGCRTPDGFTHGCVALDNEAMDVLWNYCNLGVPVTIGP